MIAAVSHSLLAFQQRFPDEAHCAQFLLERRWPDGFVCPGCGGKRGHLLRSRAYTYECVACGKQTSVTAGTVMHRTKLPLTVWFWAAHLMATHSNGMSAQQLMGQLGLGSYNWLLAQKLRRSMVDPEREPLKGVVEIDQCLSVPTKRSSRSPSPAKCSSLARSRSSITQSRRNPRDLVRSILTRCPAAGRDPEQRGDAHPRVHQGKHCAGHDTGVGRVLSGARGLPPRSPRGRQHGRAPQMDPSGLRPLEAVEPRHLPPPPTHRFVPERIRLPLQPAILSICLVRDRAWLGDAPRAGSLLGHHRAEKPSQSFPDNQATATPSQDSQRISSGRRAHLKLGRSVIRR